MNQNQFAQRLAELRVQKGVSARDMSLSMGQSDSYINKVENGQTFPSMSVFFYICDYLDISPKDFFDFESTNPTKANELFNVAKGLKEEQLDSLIALAKGLK